MPTTNVRGYLYPEALRTMPGFTDTSYGNDVTDSVVFFVQGPSELHGFIVWIDNEDPVMRAPDNGPDAPRFMVCQLRDGVTGSLAIIDMEETIGAKDCGDELVTCESAFTLIDFVRGLS